MGRYMLCFSVTELFSCDSSVLKTWPWSQRKPQSARRFQICYKMQHQTIHWQIGPRIHTLVVQRPRTLWVYLNRNVFEISECLKIVTSWSSVHTYFLVASASWVKLLPQAMSVLCMPLRSFCFSKTELVTRRNNRWTEFRSHRNII